MGRRVRKHANPFQVVTRLGRLDRLALFGRQGPVEVDVGSGGGDFLLQRARSLRDRDFVGFEIRKPLVDAANSRARAEGLKNVVFFRANVHDNLDFVEPGAVLKFFVQFPDPCFKRRHWKRRLIQPFFIRRMVELMPLEGEVFVQSDVPALAEEMHSFLCAERALRSRWGGGMLVPNPFEERTEWERHHEREGEPVYRMLFEKVQTPSGDIPHVEFRDTNPLRVGTAAGPSA